MLTNLIDDAYRLKEEIDEKKKRLDEIKAMILEQGKGEFEGSTARAVVSVRTTTTLDPAKVFSAVDNPEEFCGLVKVSNSKAKKFLSKSAFEEAATRTETLTVSLAAKN